MTSSSLLQVLRASELGDFEPCRRWLAVYGSTQSVAVRSVMWLAGLEGDVPSLDAADPSSLGQLAHLGVVRMRAILSFDVALLTQTRRALEAFEARESGEREERADQLEVTRLWEVVALGTADHESLERAKGLEARAAARGAAGLVIQIASGRALAALDVGDLEEATAHARRASRMASAEELPQGQYLANVVLARMRRLSDRPHLALRILTALRAVVSRPWSEWLEWELCLAGDPRGAASAKRLRGALEALLASARRGAPGEVASVAGKLELDTAGFAPLRRDLAALMFCLDPARPLAVGSSGFLADAKAWRAGHEPLPPNGLQALCLAERQDHEAAAFVVADPDGIRCRVLQLGMPILPDLEQRFRLPESLKKRLGQGKRVSKGGQAAVEPSQAACSPLNGDEEGHSKGPCLGS